jgi:hypothetical protein
MEMRMKVALIFFLSLVAGAGWAGTALPTTAYILADIQKLETEKDKASRIELADHLENDMSAVWRARGMDCIDEKVIDALIPLLDDDTDSVRAAAASGIGYFGVRAGRALPALERALQRISDENASRQLPFMSGWDSADAIVPAMRRVRGIPDDETLDQPPVPSH